ncbi:MAG TPA: amidohydrolase family protein, partial [Aquirhabdus sp.]
ADFQLGVDMVSTGEVACFGRTPAEAYWKGIQASPVRLPTPGQNILLSIGAYKHKNEFLASAQQLSDLGYKLYGTGGTCDFLLEKGLTITELPIRQQGAVHGERQVDNLAHRSQTTQTSIRSSANRENLLDYLADKRFGLVINTSRQNKILNEGQLRRQRQASGYLIRRTAIDNGVPLITDIKTAKFLVKALTYGFVNRLPNITVETHIDCLTNQQLIRLPGLIDVHVHLREPGGESKEDWSSGTQSALAGGITQVCAMPNTNPAITDLVSFELVSEIARTKAHCDYAIFVGANSQNLETVSELAPAAAGLKMYLNQTYGTLKLEKTTDWLTHLSNWKHTKRPVCVHAEGQTLAAVLHLANLSQCPIHVCHVSSREEIEIIKASKLAGQAVTCEVTPHHLFLTNTHIPEPYSSVKPPLMTEDDQKALWENLEYIDCFATDHAPHLKADKCASKCPGFPGLESALPLLLTAVKQGRMTLDDIILRYHTNPRRIFDLPAQPDTYIEVDLNCQWTLPD